MHILSALILAIIPLGVFAHTMNPASQKIYVMGASTYVKYTIENKFNVPAVFEMELLEKDLKTIFTKWQSDSKKIRLPKGTSRDVYLKIDTTEERKLYVCSKLDKVGYDESPSYTITRICAKLWLKR